MACEHCRAKKIRCDSAKPSCTHCDQRSLPCVYVNERQKRRRLSGTEIENRFRQLEELFEQQGGASPTQVTTRKITEPDIRHGASTALYKEAFVHDRSHGPSEAPLAGLLRSHGPSSRHDPALWLSDGDEYTGPSSGISLLSVQGLEWIHETLGARHCLPFSTFEDLRMNLLSHLRVPKCIVNDPWPSDASKGDRTPLPGPAEIWLYIYAYFDVVQTIFSVLDRQQFVMRATRYLASPHEDDPSWYALFNAVLASGCRVALATESPEGFSKSGNVGWGYFMNALAMESNMIHKSTDLTAVQAFTVMTVYAQGLSSPQRLEFTLCSIAARLSHGLGMHRRPAKEWNLDVRQRSERNRVFWIIYCLDKTIALRCGRPCTFDDDDIDCEVPTMMNNSLARPSPHHVTRATGISNPAFNFLGTYTELARIHGLVAKRLYSAKALGAAPDQLKDTAKVLLQNLETWRLSIPDLFKPGPAFRPSTLSGLLSLDQSLAMHFGYFDLICAIHRRFSPRFRQPGENITSVLPDGASSHIEAAKQMILLTKHLDTQSYTPGWLLFYYPMTALLEVFSHVISNPGDTSVKNDIALMEVVVGFFGRLEYLTSGVAAFTKTAEVVKQARIAVEHDSEHETPDTSNVTDGATVQTHEAPRANLSSDVMQHSATSNSIIERTNKDARTSGSSFDPTTPTRRPEGFNDNDCDFSTWPASWSPPVDDAFEHGESTSAIWTSMDTSLSGGILHYG